MKPTKTKELVLTLDSPDNPLKEMLLKETIAQEAGEEVIKKTSLHNAFPAAPAESERSGHRLSRR